jgi:hypothetical protein
VADRAAPEQSPQRAVVDVGESVSVISRSATIPCSRNQSSARAVNAVTVAAVSSSQISE